MAVGSLRNLESLEVDRRIQVFNSDPFFFHNTLEAIIFLSNLRGKEKRL